LGPPGRAFAAADSCGTISPGP